jgi:aryl-alcohol dehydrogenase-like predicted oxidoreductase
MARAFDISVTAWSPLASGILSGKYARPGGSEEKRLDKAKFVQLSDRNLAIARAVDEVAKSLGHTSSQVALSWLCQPAAVIPILGARKLAQFKDNLGCLSCLLPAEQIAKLDAASRVDLGFPHDFLASEMVRDVMFGGTYSSIDQ